MSSTASKPSGLAGFFGVPTPVVPYVSESGSARLIPAERDAVPFPPNAISPLFRSETFLLEKVGGRMYLRSRLYSHYCLAVETEVREFTKADFDDLSVPDDLDFRWPIEVIFQGRTMRQSHAVGYQAMRPSRMVFFLDVYVWTAPVDELPPLQALLYTAATGFCGGHEVVLLEHLRAPRNGQPDPAELRFDRSLLVNYWRSRDTSKTASVSPAPMGAWEQQAFDELFGGDASLMTDDEYQMIFGQDR